MKLLPILLAVFALLSPLRCFGFQEFLINELGNARVDAGATKAIVLFHGWNPSGDADMYSSSDDLYYLKNILSQRLNGTGWNLIAYHWEQEAATGFITFDSLFPPDNATRAAEHALTEGEYLGLLLNRTAPQLRQVHFIAHSAGAWAARQAMKKLLELNPYVVVQMTLLDPFIPGSVLPFTHGQNNNVMAASQYLASSDRIHRLESYFANDSPLDGSNPFFGDSPTLGTQDTFVWRSGIDINQQVDWGVSPGLGHRWYDHHGGPTEFYADNVKASIPGETVEPGQYGLLCPFDYENTGFRKSLFYEAYLRPQIGSQPQSQSGSQGTTVNMTISGQRINNVAWFKVGSSQVVGSGASLPVVIGSNTVGDYVARVSNQYGLLFSTNASVSLSGSPPPPAAPTITTVLPNPLAPSPALKTIRIIGSGYTGSSTLLLNGNIPSVPARLTLVNVNEINYSHNFETSGDWTVVVVNGGQQSNVKHFTVQAPLVSSGSLSVRLSAQGGGIPAGAQWRVDGDPNFHNSDDPSISLTPGLHTVSFKPVAGYTTPLDQPVSVAANMQTTAYGVYTPVTATTYTLNINTDVSKGSVYRNPNRNTFSPGETVRLTADYAPGWHFDHWSGDASGSGSYVDVVMNSDKTVTANWASGDGSLVTITVTIDPPEASTAGARWRVDGSEWKTSGQSLTGRYLGSHYLEFSDITGWTRPVSYNGDFVRGATNLTARYTQTPQPTYLQVVIRPQEAVTAGAQWRVDGGDWQNGGATIPIAPGANRLVEFKPVAGWAAPASQPVSVVNGQTRVVNGSYNPPPGVPLITTVSPGVGPLAGGTLLNIVGANFAAPATVSIGGQSASNVTVLSPTQITCFTPSNAVYGSAPVSVQTSGGTATSPNGFAYGVSRGIGLELAGNIGGSTYCLAVQGDYLFVGEGASFVVFNIANPSAPALVTRLALPGRVLGLSLFSANGRSYVCVANGDAGVQIVEITIPTAPVLKGYYQTSGSSQNVTTLGGIAYVADGDGGLKILDISNPLAPTLIGFAPTSDFANCVAVKVTASGVFAHVLTSSGLQIIDVTDPAAPSSRGSVSFNVWGSAGFKQLALIGNKAFVATFANLQVVDISNPDSPTIVESMPQSYTAVAAVGTMLYAYDGTEFIIFDANGPTLSVIGGTFQNIPFGFGNSIAVANGVAFVANLELGFFTVSVSNPSAPVFNNTYRSEAGAFQGVIINGQYAYTACNRGGMKVFDVSNPAMPTKVSQPSTSTDASSILLANGKVYSASSEIISIFDITAPTAPTLQGTIPASLIRSSAMCRFGQFLLVSGYNYVSYHAELAVVNVSSPAAPQLQGAVELVADGNNNPRAIACVGSKACVGVWNVGVIIVDSSDSSTPVVRGTIPIGGDSGSLAMTADGNYLFVGTYGYLSTRALQIFDIRNPSSPTLVYSNYLGGAVFSIVLQGNTAYMGVGLSIKVFDVSNLASPALVRSFPTTDVPYGLSVSGDYIYVANNNSGLTVLKMIDLEVPTIFITNPTFSTRYTNYSSTVNLGGGASDNKGVTRVIWSNDRGGGGDATGTDSWTVSNIALQPGTNILTVTAIDAAGNCGNDTLTVIYNSPKTSQSITFSNITDRIIGDAPFPLTAWASSGLPVSFSIVSGPATVASNVVTITGAGTITVRGSQGGDAAFSTAGDVDRTFAVNKAGQVITFGSIPAKRIGDPPFIVEAAASSGEAVTLSVVSGPATVSANTVTLTGAGAVVLRATQAGNASYLAASADATFTVGRAAQVISFGALSRQVFGDAPFALSASSSSGLPVSFAILSGPAVVDGNIVTLTGTGLVVVRVAQPGDATYAPAPYVDQVLIVTTRENAIGEIRRFLDGRFSFGFVGDFNRSYRVEYSTNLADWLPLTTNSVNALGTLEITDGDGTGQPRRFYRVKGL